MKEYPIDREAFKAWLSENSTQIVGKICKSCDCPVANFIAPLEPQSRVVVDGAQVILANPGRIVSRGESHLLPAWARLFILELDSTKEPGDAVTGLEALSAFGFATAE